MKKIIRNFISFCRKYKAEKPKRFYNIDGFDMDLGEGHMLSLSQKNHHMYDRFVPFLGLLSERCKSIGGGKNI